MNTTLANAALTKLDENFPTYREDYPAQALPEKTRRVRRSSYGAFGFDPRYPTFVLESAEEYCGGACWHTTANIWFNWKTGRITIERCTNILDEDEIRAIITPILTNSGFVQPTEDDCF